ncbi:protein of unknown function [Shewanella benthica]|uniref:Uncharacterized protein n=1 Tax=Shewanella benthica TaxID=43661 RepID=A0A330LXI1_9GAMM|nr:hypothetical protein [Shewanella benthica]SQH74591.1 protein of unknown function [Shewanella benthica]
MSSSEALDGLKDLHHLSEIVGETVTDLELLARTKPKLFEVVVNGAGNIFRLDEAIVSNKFFSDVVHHISDNFGVGDKITSTREMPGELEVESRPKTEAVYKKLEAWGYIKTISRSKTVLLKPFTTIPDLGSE